MSYRLLFDPTLQKAPSMLDFTVLFSNSPEAVVKHSLRVGLGRLSGAKPAWHYDVSRTSPGPFRLVCPDTYTYIYIYIYTYMCVCTPKMCRCAYMYLS